MSAVSITVQGGLGNQMFQLAAAYAHARALGVPFQVQRTKAADDGRPLYWESALWQFQPFLTSAAPSTTDAPQWKEPHGATKYTEMPDRPVHLDGYFQSSKYFRNLPRAEVAALFAPRLAVVRSVHEKCADLLASPENVIVVHARRGDYCKNAGMIAFHGPLPPSYYAAAIARMSTNAGATFTRVPSLLFVSDDNSFWTREVFPVLPTSVSALERHVLEGLDEEETLYLLSQFQHFVIANSTFSWWGAWLSGPRSRVIAPRAWFGPAGLRDYEDIYEVGWERL
jgi:hypothetical protein